MARIHKYMYIWNLYMNLICVWIYSDFWNYFSGYLWKHKNCNKFTNVRGIWLQYLPCYDWQGILWDVAYGPAPRASSISPCASPSNQPSLVTLLFRFTFTRIVWILETNQSIVEALACKRLEKSIQRSEGSPYSLYSLKPKQKFNSL